MPRLSPRGLSWISEICYAFIVFIVACLFAVSCISLLAQAVTTAPNRSWTNNWDAVIIAASYFIVFAVSFAFCLKRRIAVRRKLQRITKRYRGIGKNDVPKAVHAYIIQEYARSCLVAYEIQPKDITHEGWGKPGTKTAGIYFRRALLDTISEIDALACAVIPSHPPLRPHARMIHHFRFIEPLLPADEYDLTALQYYDSAIQLARISELEPTEYEFELGMKHANEIKRILNECRLEMLEEVTTATHVGSALSD